MTKTVQEMMEVMQHFANGGEVEAYERGKWVCADAPCWNWDVYDYRIKQTPKKVKYWCCDTGGQLTWVTNETIPSSWKRIPQLDMEVTE